MVSEITSIQFGILNDQDIIDQAVCLIDKHTLTPEIGSVYDPRMGTATTGVKCETCQEDEWTCPGHFGYINLNMPIILFYKQVVNMLKCFCFQCHRLLYTKEELQLNKVRRYSNVFNLVSKSNMCMRCITPHPEIKFNSVDNTIIAQFKFKCEKTVRELDPTTIKRIFDDIPNEDVELLGVDTSMFHPKCLVLTKFPVIPITCRPRMMSGDMVSDDDLSIILADIVKNNHIITSDKDKDKVERAIQTIKFKTLTYCDNSKGKAVHNTNHKPIMGIKERVARKEGHMRKNLMGKRSNQTGRTVVGPDPTLKVHQVAMPYEMARALTIPEYVMPMNLAKMTALVNRGDAMTIHKPDGRKISVANALLQHGTHLKHGDVITNVTTGKERIVTNCKDTLMSTDTVTRNGAVIPTVVHTKRRITLELGDKIDRYLIDGDIVLINRQPTLHKNSMQSMEVVRKPGKTLRINLANTKGFNADFDGDEFNVFIPQCIEAQTELRLISFSKNHILSVQSNKPEIVIVQDSLLGAYLMTIKPVPMPRHHFQDCIHKTNALTKYDYTTRLNEIRLIRKEEGYNSVMLMGFVLPSDFMLDIPTLTIRFGVIVKGFLDKMTLGPTRHSLIRTLCLEYGNDVTCDFIDNIQFITNAWLEHNAFSVGINDCLIPDPQKLKDINLTINKYFAEADQMGLTTDNSDILESRVNCSLNKAKDIGLKIAKDALHPTNNFISTVASGSKGDYFNIAQITGLLGQQNINGKRPSPTMTNGTRTLIHYPCVISDSKCLYESRGFISSSFMKGLTPKEMFFHAMSGREGIIKTSMETATSGYNQRRTIKLNEDLKVAYDGTVRDANQNIYQFAYGNHGFSPSKTTTIKGEVYPCDVNRLAARLNVKSSAELRQLTVVEIEDICELALPKMRGIPLCVGESIRGKNTKILKNVLNTVSLASNEYEHFKQKVVDAYNTALVQPGEMVGILCGQSIGEKQTQTTLNTFHTAGKLQQTSVDRFQELINTTKNLKYKTCTVWLKEKYETAESLRNAIGSSLVSATLKTMCAPNPKLTVTETTVCIMYTFLRKNMIKYRFTPYQAAEKLKQEYDDCVLTTTSTTLSVLVNTDESHPPELYANKIRPDLEKIIMCGIPGITGMHLAYEDGEWVISTVGSNLKKLLSHPLVDVKRLYCNDVWEVNDCLGIVAARKSFLKDLKETICNINNCHTMLLVDKIMHKGKPTSITRYSMRTNNVGPLSRASFEESIDTVVNAAMTTEVEYNRGVSASIICGNQCKIGTGYMGIRIDIDKLIAGYDKPIIPSSSSVQIPKLSYALKTPYPTTTDHIEVNYQGSSWLLKDVVDKIEDLNLSD